MSKVVILALFIGLFMNVLADEIKLTNEASIDSVLKEMTLEEKAKLVGEKGKMVAKEMFDYRKSSDILNDFLNTMKHK